GFEWAVLRWAAASRARMRAMRSRWPGGAVPFQACITASVLLPSTRVNTAQAKASSNTTRSPAHLHQGGVHVLPHIAHQVQRDQERARGQQEQGRGQKPHEDVELLDPLLLEVEED